MIEFHLCSHLEPPQLADLMALAEKPSRVVLVGGCALISYSYPREGKKLTAEPYWQPIPN